MVFLLLQLKIVAIAFLMLMLLLTHPQLFEGLKEESQVENNGKGEGVGARSLTRSTRGVEGRAGVLGLD
jgi:hypothetical protein